MPRIFERYQQRKEIIITKRSLKFAIKRIIRETFLSLSLFQSLLISIRTTQNPPPLFSFLFAGKFWRRWSSENKTHVKGKKNRSSERGIKHKGAPAQNFPSLSYLRDSNRTVSLVSSASLNRRASRRNDDDDVISPSLFHHACSQTVGAADEKRTDRIFPRIVRIDAGSVSQFRGAP